MKIVVTGYGNTGDTQPLVATLQRAAVVAHRLAEEEDGVARAIDVIERVARA